MSSWATLERRPSEPELGIWSTSPPELGLNVWLRRAWRGEFGVSAGQLCRTTMDEGHREKSEQRWFENPPGSDLDGNPWFRCRFRVDGGSILMPCPMPLGSRIKCRSATPQVVPSESRDLSEGEHSSGNTASPPRRAPYGGCRRRASIRGREGPQVRKFCPG